MHIEDIYKIFKEFPSVETDTRKLKKGDIFFALKGPSFNGNNFAKQALEAGAAYVVVDSHLDLPVINKSLRQLDSLELYPFKRMFEAGVPSVMIAHLYIPAIDSTPNTATSLSKKNVTGLLREKLHFDGLTFTDALGMKGVAKFFPGGQIAAQSLIAGNDMLCLPEDVPSCIAKIREAIDSNKLTWNDIYEKCKKSAYL